MNNMDTNPNELGTLKFWEWECNWYTCDIMQPKGKPWLRTALTSHMDSFAKRHSINTSYMKPAIDKFFRVEE